MSTPTEIERQNLEAHVEICAVRYSNLESKLGNFEQRLDKMELYLVKIKDALEGKLEDRSRASMHYLIIIFGTILSGLLAYIGHGLFK